MIVRATGKRFIAACFLAFFGLNLVGVFCLSHCNLGAVIAAAKADDEQHSSSHCDPKPAAHHEEKAEAGDNDNNSVTGFDQCCDPGFGIVTTLNRSVIDIAHAVPAETKEHQISHSFTILTDRDITAPLVYRPPPNDQRIARKLNCVFRI